MLNKLEIFQQRSRLILMELSSSLARAFRRDESTLAHAPQVVALEDRVLLSASPLGAIGADVVESTEEALGQATSTEIVFIDPAAEVDSEPQLLELLSKDNPDLVLVQLDADRDGVEQITEYLSGKTNIDAVHIVSHGVEGGFQLGNTWVTKESLESYANSLVSWRDSFAVDGDLLIYGCDLAASEEGRYLTEAIAELCDCDVAASDDLTGHESLGGDWDLEFATGSIETSVVFSASAQFEWRGLLAGELPPVLNLPNGPVNYLIGNPATIIDPSSSASDPDSTDFAGGTLTITLSANGTANDRLTIESVGDISLQGASNIRYSPGGPPQTIGSWTGGTDGSTPLVISLTGSATPTSITELLRAIAIENVSPTPSTTARTVEFVLADGDGGVSVAATETINVIDPVPVIDLDGNDSAAVGTSYATAYQARGNPVSIVDLDFSYVDLDSTNWVELTVDILGNPSDRPNEVIGYDLSGTGITLSQWNANAGRLILEGDRPISEYLQVLQTLTYENTAITDTTPRTIEIHVEDAEGNLSNVAVSTIYIQESSQIWFTTQGDLLPGTGVAELTDWDDEQVLSLSDPTFGAGNSGGTISSIHDLDPLGESEDINAIHFVSRSITVEGEALQYGDLIMSTKNGFLSFDPEDVFYYRPTDLNNYDAGGTYTMLVNNLNGDFRNIEAVTLVEQNTMVAGQLLQSGSLLFQATDNDNDIYHYQNGSSSLFINGDDPSVGISGKISGLDLIERPMVMGVSPFDQAFTEGQILVTTLSDGAFSDEDIFILDVTGTEWDGIGMSAGSKTLLFQGANKGLTTPEEAIDGLTLYASEGAAAPSNNVAPVISSDGGGSTASINVAENNLTVTTVIAVDPEAPPQILSYSIVPGADSSQFSIDGTTGVLSFVTPPDFEIASDIGTNNVYDLIVQVSDGNGGSDTQLINVTVTDVAEGNTLVVDTTSDVSDGITSSIGALLNNRGDDGFISLREAIEATNNTLNLGTPDGIYFNILGAGPHVINLTSALPFITDSVIIDATTEPDFLTAPVVRIDGAGLGDVSGLVLDSGSDDSTIRGLSITGFNGANNGMAILVTSDSNLIAGNYLGVDTDGITGIGNRIGLELKSGASDNRVGGTIAADSNVMSDNSYAGINLKGNGTDDNLIYGNYIGTDADGLGLLGNGIFGVLAWDQADSNVIGGTAAGQGNVIAGNRDGVVIDTTATNNSIRGNSIHSNTQEGIDLSNDGVTSNDIGDFDSGSNKLQNYPVLSAATISGLDLTIAGTLFSSPFTSFEIDFYATTTGDASLHGEGERYLGSASGSTGFLGTLSINELLTGVGVGAGEFISATATDSNGNTSEFSLNIIAAGPVLVNSPPSITSDGGGATAAINVAENTTAVTTVTATDPDLPGDTLTYTISGGADFGDFSINSSTGVLTLTSGKDFETFADSDLDGVYEVEVTVDDGNGLDDVQSISVTITDENEIPTISSNGGGATANINVAENTTAVTIVTATDPDLPGDTLTYTISGGADFGDFSINPSTGVLTLTSGKDFETFADSDLDGVYEVEVTVDDGNGLSDVQSISVTITDENETPTITSNGGGATANINVAENTTAVTTVTATDPDLPADTLTYTISGGADSGDFTINSSTGSLTFLAGKVFATPSDADLNGVYEVEVTVDDGNGLNDVQTINVTVTDSNGTPMITSNGGGATAIINVAENATAVTTVIATDPDLPGDTLTYTISGGDDAGDFAIDSGSGVLTFVSAKDFETFSDSDLDGVYEVAVTVDDGNGLSDVQWISVAVTDINEMPVVIGATSINSFEDASPIVIDLTNWFDDVDAADLNLNETIQSVTMVGLNAVIDPVTHQLTIWTDPNKWGTGLLTVRATDGSGLFVEKTVAVNVTPVNDTVSIGNQFLTGFIEQAVLGNLLPANVDVDGESLSVIITNPSANGILIVNPDGSFSFTPDAEFSGTTSFSFQVDDGVVPSNIATVEISVLAAASTPVTNDTKPPKTESDDDQDAEIKAADVPSLEDKGASETRTGNTAKLETTAGEQESSRTSSEDDMTSPLQADDVEVPIWSSRPDFSGSEFKQVSSIVAAPAAATSAFVVLSQPGLLWNELSEFRQSAMSDFAFSSVAVGSVGTVTSGLIVGYVIWAIRSGLLLSSLVAALPAWNLLDPLAIVSVADGNGNENGESLEEIVETQKKIMRNSN